MGFFDGNDNIIGATCFFLLGAIIGGLLLVI